MVKLLVYTDGRTAAASALRFAARLKERLYAELSVITVRSGTHGVEEPPQLGIDFPLEKREALSGGLQILAGAVDILAEEGLLDPSASIRIHDMPLGHVFICKSPGGERIPFYECFGHFTEAINQEVDEHAYDLLIIAPPHRGKLRRVVAGSTTRKLALDLHTSLLVVRGGGPDNRYLICADGSPSSRRQFPLLKLLMPAIKRPVDLICVKRPDADDQAIRTARECIEHAGEWLENCGKKGTFHLPEGDRPADIIIQTAGSDSVIVMGASLRHDVYRRLLGSLPMQILEETDSSVLLVKLPPGADADLIKDPFVCG
jgi:nucleotide-binding universal stress UspA family protein